MASSALTLTLLRHGETDYNSLGIVQGQGVNGPLNQTGYAQAAGVGRMMRLSAVDIASVSYSDQVRTQESAAGFIRGYHGLPCSDDDRSIPALEQADIYSSLRERAKGAQEGRLNNLSLGEAENLDAEENRPPRLWESQEDVCKRLRVFMAEFLSKNKEGHHLVVTHGGCVRIFVRDIFQLAGDNPVKVYNSSTTTVSILVKNDEPTFENATLLSDIGDLKYIPPELVTTRSDH